MTDTTTVAPAGPGVPPHQRILDIIGALSQNRALAAAAELEIADALAAGPLHIDVLAARTNTEPSHLLRLLRALVTIGIFAQVSPGQFANSPVSELLRKDHPQSFWAGIRMQSLLYYAAWAGLPSSIRHGRAAFDQMHDENVWQYLQRHPDIAMVFDQAMRSITNMATPAVTAGYDWGRFPLIVDIGGGIGTQLTSILEAHPQTRGLLMDRADVLEGVIRHDRMDAIAGDFFVRVPPEGDAYLLRFVVHDWPDDQALTVLRNVRAAMTGSSRVMVIEVVVGEGAGATPGVWMDLSMMIVGGRERTATEYRDLLNRAGFDVEEVVPTRSPFSIIVGKPTQVGAHTSPPSGEHAAAC